MSKQEILDKLEEIGISELTIKDLFGRGVTKRSLKEIFENITKENESRKVEQQDNELHKNWLKRTFYFASQAHILLLIYSPRLYVLKNAPICANLADSLDDLKIQVDSAVDGFDSDLYIGKLLELQKLGKDIDGDVEVKDFPQKIIDSLLHNPLTRGLRHVVPTYNYVKINRPLIYQKLHEAQEILKDNWEEGLEYIDNKSAKENFLSNVAEGREIFHLDITEWD